MGRGMIELGYGILVGVPAALVTLGVCDVAHMGWTLAQSQLHHYRQGSDAALFYLRERRDGQLQTPLCSRMREAAIRRYETKLATSATVSDPRPAQRPIRAVPKRTVSAQSQTTMPPRSRESVESLR